MSEVWNALARDYGRRCVLDLNITDDEVDKITKEQAHYVIPLLKRQITGADKTCLDYGCGAGRWTKRLSRLFNVVMGYDPSTGLLDLAERGTDTFTSTVPKTKTFNVIFNWVVLGGIDDDELVPTVHSMIALLAPNGLLFFADHMKHPGRETWWRFRSMPFYSKLFADVGLPLRRIGECRQLQHSVTIMAGRKRNIDNAKIP